MLRWTWELCDYFLRVSHKKHLSHNKLHIFHNPLLTWRELIIDTLNRQVFFFALTYHYGKKMLISHCDVCRTITQSALRLVPFEFPSFGSHSLCLETVQTEHMMWAHMPGLIPALIPHHSLRYSSPEGNTFCPGLISRPATPPLPWALQLEHPGIFSPRQGLASGVD